MIGVRIRGFDGLRALAFLLVFISHKAPSPLRDRYGTAGVWIFFVLSGFLITRILAEARGGIEADEVISVLVFPAFTSGEPHAFSRCITCFSPS